MKLAAKAKRLTHKLLEETTVLFTRDTILGWYHRLIAQEYDGSENCKNPGRPKNSQEITDLAIRFKEEHSLMRFRGMAVIAEVPQNTVSL